MKKILLIGLGVLVSGIILGQPLDINLLKARACMDQNKIDSALRILTSVQGSQPNYVLDLWLGDCYFHKADLKKASHFYLLADSLNKGSSSYELSCIYAKQNNKNKAIDWLEKYLATPNKKTELDIRRDSSFRSISSSPEWKTCWTKDWYSESETEENAVNALLSKGKASEAMSELESYEDKFSPRHKYFYLQAKIYEKQHLLAPALAVMEKAITFNSFSDDYLALYADLLKDNKKYNDALDYINKAIRINPYHSLYYLKRGEIARLAGNYKQAEKDLRMYKDLYPENLDTYHQLGLLESSQGNNQNAMEFYDILLTKDRTNAQYFVERGSIALTIEQIQKADEDFSLALDLNPNNQEAYLKKGNTLRILNDQEGACFYWSEAKRLGSSEAAKLMYQNCKN
ncbi:MAG TPA: tetratricopeptide repeat protein [Bacteroidales bacterium]